MKKEIVICRIKQDDSSNESWKCSNITCSGRPSSFEQHTHNKNREGFKISVEGRNCNLWRHCELSLSPEVTVMENDNVLSLKIVLRDYLFHLLASFVFLFKLLLLLTRKVAVFIHFDFNLFLSALG